MNNQSNNPTRGNKRKAQWLWAAGIILVALVAAVILKKPETSNKDMDKGHAGHNMASMAGGGGGKDSPVRVTLGASQAARLGILFARARSGVINTRVEVLGQVAADERQVRIITARTDGIIERLYLGATGEFVAKGQPLYRLYSPMAQEVAGEWRIAKKLGAESGRDAEAAAQATRLIESVARRAEALGLTRGELEAIGEDGRLLIRTSASGVIVERMVSEGGRIMNGDIVARLADLSVVAVEGDVYEKDLPGIKTGGAGHISVEGYPGRSWLARVTLVAPILANQTRTAKVRFIISNSDGALKPGMAATISFEAIKKQTSILVPRGAVVESGRRNIVFVRGNNGQITSREVVTGQKGDTEVEVIEGLTNGEEVVINGTFFIEAEGNLGQAMAGMQRDGTQGMLGDTDGSARQGIKGVENMNGMEDMKGMPGMGKEHQKVSEKNPANVSPERKP